MIKKILKLFVNKWIYTNLISFSIILFSSLSLTIKDSKIKTNNSNELNNFLFADTNKKDDHLSDWTSQTQTKKLVDVFRNTKVALRILSILITATTNGAEKFNQGVNSLITKTDLEKINILDLSDLDLTEINDVLNPQIIWTGLYQINLSNNNFGDYEIVFKKTNMPKLYKIIATNANLNYMINVSDYVLDPYDKSEDSTDARTSANGQYIKPATDKVPRFFDLANNNIKEISKYYLKINIGYLDLANNKLGMGTLKDPMGVNATPWYSLSASLGSSNFLKIQDSSIRGPYGINVYNTGEKNSDNSYKYTDEQVARWRQSPFPIKSLTFGNYNDVINTTTKAFDDGITHIKGTTKATGGKKPYFNLINNNLVAPMIFDQTNTDFDSNSSIAPQSKTVNVFVGIEDFKKSKYYTDQNAIIKKLASTWKDNPNANAEMLVPQPDSIYPFLNQIGFSDSKTSGFTWNRPLFNLYTIRSFNGFGLFEQTTDSRKSGLDYDQWDNNPGTSGKVKNAGTISQEGGGIKWSVPKASDFKNKKDSTNYEFNYDKSNGIEIDDFIRATGTQSSNSEKVGFWGQNEDINSTTSTKVLDFSSSSDSSQTSFKRYKPFRTYLITAKSFTKKGITDTYSPSFDSNVYYDTKGYENYSFNIKFSPNTKTINSFDPNYGVLQLKRKLNQIKHFENFYLTNVTTIINSLAPANWLSNINQDSSFGIKKSTAENPINEFASSYEYINGLYNYTSFFNVINKIETQLDNALNFASSTLNNNGLNLSLYENKFPQSVSVNQILDGKNKFWKSDKAFDETYLAKLNQNEVKTIYDASKGTLNYQFHIYSPGYSRNGRLFLGSDTTDLNKNETKTIDVKVDQTVSDFAKAKLQLENNLGVYEDINPDSISDSLKSKITSAPKSISELIKSVNDYKNLTDEKIANAFKTNYLGNEMITGFNQKTIENSDHSLLKTVNKNWIKNVIKNANNGTIQFNLEIPDFSFSNRNILKYSKKLKEVTYIWNNLPKSTSTIIGKLPNDLTSSSFSFIPFKPSSFTKSLADKLTMFETIIKKPASQITALDIFNLNPVTKTDVSTWNTTVNASNVSDYIKLFPNNANGSLIFQIYFPPDPENFINQQIATVLWEGLANQSTSVSWKTQEQLTSLLLGKTPDMVLKEFKTDPSLFLNTINLVNDKLSFSDLEFDEKNSALTNMIRGQIQFSSIQLKNYYQNGIKFINGISTSDIDLSSKSTSSTITSPTTPVYLNLALSPNYQAQPPVSSIVWKEDNQILKIIKDYIKDNDLIQLNPYQFDLSTDTKRKNEINKFIENMNAYDYKKAIVDNNLNLANIGVFELKNIQVNDFVFGPNTLNNAISVNNQTGAITFKNLVFNNWQENNSFTTQTHTLDKKVVHSTPLINSFKWSLNLSPALSVLTTNQIKQIFESKKEAEKYIDGLNVGKKTFNGITNELENKYTVDVSKIEIDVINGSLTFKPKAITISNFITKKEEKAADFVVEETKTYTLLNKPTTNYYINRLITSPNGYEDKFSDFYFGTTFKNATTQQKQAFNDLNAPNFVFTSPNEAIGLIKESIINKNEAKISASDLIKIKSLQNEISDDALKAIDFSNYFYLPSYLAFVTSFSSTGVERTYFIGSQIQKVPSALTSIVINNVYIINYLKNGKFTILSLGNLVYPGFLRNGTTISFKKATDLLILPIHLRSNEFSPNNQFNYLNSLWKNATPQQMKADLDFFTNNKDDVIVNQTSRYLKIQAAWKSMFTYENVPYEGGQDDNIAYPKDIIVSNGEHTLKVTALLFPYYIKTKFKDNSSPINLNTIIKTTQIWYLNNGNSTIFHVNSQKEFEAFLNQTPNNALEQLNLKEGIQDDPEKTFNAFLMQNIFLFINLDPSVLTANKNLINYLKPTGEIGSIKINWSSGIMTLSDIKIKNMWNNGDLEIIKTINKITLNFLVASSKLYVNDNNNVISWLKTKYGTNKSLAEMLFDLKNDIKNNKFNINEFNDMLQSNNDLVYLDSLFNDPNTKAQLKPNFSLINSFKIDYVNATISLENLEIVNGYLLNLKQKNPINVNPIKIDLKSDFSTNFNANFQPIIDSKKFNGVFPSLIQNVLKTGSFDLNQYIKYNHAFEKIETPEIKISANDVLGTITFNVHFNKYYQDGILIGPKSFKFEYSHLRAHLSLILGLVGAFVGISLIGIGYLIYKYYVGKKDLYIQKVSKNKKIKI